MKNRKKDVTLKRGKFVKNIKISAGLLVVVWMILVIMVWTFNDKAISEGERRLLKQKPELKVESLLDGYYMKEFEEYVLDQFPFRDGFRKMKSTVHYYGFQQKDNNGIYIYKDHANKMDYPLNRPSVDFAINRFNRIYDSYLKGKTGKIVMAMVPDKGYYMAKDSGHLTYDYNRLMERVEEKIPWAEHVKVSDLLELNDYYRTDSHWRQEKILPVAERLGEKLGVTVCKDYKYEKIERDFYGVYYGQAALPMKPDRILLMKNPMLDQCKVYDHEKGEYLPIYNMDKAQGRDMYETYLSGAKALLEIENPKGIQGKELIVFRDSFASSLIPLLLESYSKVTVIDTRYITTEQLGHLVDFKGADVLFLYNTLLINNSAVLK